MISVLAEYWARFGLRPETLMASAQEYRKRAYAPYSGFLVGAALLMDDGTMVGGCNVENASYGMSICAERAAMAGAATSGKYQPLALAVAASAAVFCPPCGACRQFLSEFNPELEIWLMTDGVLRAYRLDALLPYRFRLEERPDAGRE